MHSLLNSRLSPITYSCGFLECDPQTAVDAYLNWQRPIQSARQVTIAARPAGGTLEKVLPQLLPLTNVELRRFLFMPTLSRWTVYFDNGHRSTDGFPPMSYLAGIIGCRGLRVTDTPDVKPSNQYPARILEIFGPHNTDFLNVIRSISAIYDGYKWSFTATGEVQPFEQVDRYTAKSIKDRFTHEMLVAYLAALGINFESEAFYASNAAILVEKTGPIALKAKEFSLEECR